MSNDEEKDREEYARRYVKDRLGVPDAEIDRVVKEFGPLLKLIEKYENSPPSTDNPEKYEPPERFEVMSIGEMRKKYYSSGEGPPPIRLDPQRVPELLRHLIPLAETWGISDDILRLDAMEQAAPEEVAAFRATFSQHEDSIEEWLTGPEADVPTPSPEYVAFSNMLMAFSGC